jgi:hypothetical protein
MSSPQAGSSACIAKLTNGYEGGTMRPGIGLSVRASFQPNGAFRFEALDARVRLTESKSRSPLAVIRPGRIMLY